MSLRLAAAGLLVRGRAMTRWLETVDRTVCESLAEVMGEEAVSPAPTKSSPRDPNAYRMAMAERHARLVDVLITGKGREAGVREGRQALYRAGVTLGQRLRSELGLSDGEGDLIAAARLMYRILGIEFEIRQNGDRTSMIVRRCPLSARYSALTCEVISAMDEGVVAGLRPGTSMEFVRRNTAGPCPCEAIIAWEGGR